MTNYVITTFKLEMYYVISGTLITRLQALIFLGRHSRYPNCFSKMTNRQKHISLNQFLSTYLCFINEPNNIFALKVLCNESEIGKEGFSLLQISTKLSRDSYYNFESKSIVGFIYESQICGDNLS